MKRILYIIPAAMLLMASCATQKSAYAIGGEWSVTNMNGRAITPSEETPFLGCDLNEGHIYGFTGCNRLTGSVNMKQFAAGKADFSHMGMTRMMCPDNTYEQDFMTALNKVKTSEVKGNEMLLKDGHGNTVITLVKKK